MDRVQDSRSLMEMCFVHATRGETLAGVPSVGATGHPSGGRGAPHGRQDPGPSHAALSPLLTAESRPLAQGRAQCQARVASSRPSPSRRALPTPRALPGTLPSLSLSWFLPQGPLTSPSRPPDGPALAPKQASLCCARHPPSCFDPDCGPSAPPRRTPRGMLSPLPQTDGF